MIRRQGEIVDAICKEAGIETRRRPMSPVLDKKEALQVLRYMQTLRRVCDSERGQE